MMSSALIDATQPVRPEDDFLVYAADIGNTYTLTTDCWVRLNADGGQYMNVSISGANSFPEPGSAPKHFMATRTFEQDSPPVLTKNDQFLTILGYRWVWWTWTAEPHGEVPNPRDYNTSGSVTFDLDGLSTQSDTARLGLSFYAHHWTTTSQPVPFSLSLNGKDIGRVVVSEPSALDHLIEVNSNGLRRTTNTLVITPETTETKNLPDLCFDKLEVAYPRDYVLTSDTLEFTAPESGAAPIGLTWDAPTTSVSVLDITTTVPTIVMSKGAFPNAKYIATEANRRYLATDTKAIPRAKIRRAHNLTNLLSTDNQADLIVIAWPGFISDMLPWVEYKKSLGHAVQVVDVFNVYDQFGYGNASPHAIREFIRYAAIHWQGSDKGAAAATIMLVGDSTSAYRNEFRNNVINYVPTMRRTDVGDPFASDQWFVSIFGKDPFADALIGRFSVNNNTDLRNIVRKQLDYERRSMAGPWQNTLGFIADDSGFEESVERVMKRTVPPRFFQDKIFMSQLPWIDNYYFPKAVADAREAKVSPEATDRIREMFDRGAAVVTYFGHGSPNIWSTERMWFGGDSPNSDNLLLTNKDKLAVVINMTCNSGAIDYPQPRWNVCISEDFMRVPNGGAVACFVPSGPGLTLQHERLMTEIAPTLFGNQTRSLGESFQLALWRYLAKDNPRELAEMFILLGDPLLVPHIAGPAPVNSSDVKSSDSASLVGDPALAKLPPDMTSSEGNYQFRSYNRDVMPGSIGQFTTGRKLYLFRRVQMISLSWQLPGKARIRERRKLQVLFPPLRQLLFPIV